MLPSPILVHREKKDLVFHKASEFLIKCLKLYRNITHKTLVLLSGGSAVNLYERIKYYVSSIKYKNIAFAQADERYRPNFQFSIFNFQSISNNQNINATQIRKTGLWESCEKKGISYYLISQEGSLQESAEGYDKILEKLFKEYTYKIAILGIGEDGHTAGLMPGYEKVWNIDDYAVGYEIRNEYKIRNCQKNARAFFWQKFKSRITLTPKALKELDQAIIVAAGKKKREAIKKAIDEKNSDMINEIPGVIVQQIPKVDLFTDIGINFNKNR